MGVSFTIPSSPTIRSIQIDKLYGVDLTNTPSNVNILRSPNAKNMLRETAGKNRKRMGWSVLESLEGNVNGFHVLRNTTGDKKIIHCGTSIYLWGNESSTLLYSEANNEISTSKQVGKYLWIFDGKKVLRYDGENVVTAESVAYVPTVLIGKSPSGGGTVLEAINLLSPYRIEKFSSDGSSKEYQLASDNIDSDYSLEIEQLNESGTWGAYAGEYTIDYTNGKITFNQAPAISPITGEDNISIKYKKTLTGYSDRINKCTITAMYGVSGAQDRIFASGNPDFPNWDFYCQMDDPSYWGDLWYSILGQDDSEIMGYAIVNNYLAAFKSKSENGANIFLRYGSLIDGEPTFQITGTYTGAGAISKHSFAVLDNEPLYLTASGVHALTPRDNTSDRNSELRSYFLNGHDGTGLLGEMLEKGYACTWNGFYLINFGEKTYLLDGTQSSNEYSVLYSQRQFEGYVWDNIPARIMWEYKNRLYFGTTDGKICAFNTDVGDVESYIDGNGDIVSDRWETPYIYGSNPINKTTWTYIARQLSAYVRTGDEVWAEVNGIWSKIIEQNAQAQYFDFRSIDFSNFTFSTDTTPQLLGQKIKLRGVHKVRFAFINSKAEPHGIERIYAEYRQGGKYTK